MTDIDETDAVIEDPETGKKRFKTEQLSKHPFQQKHKLTFTPITATIALTITTLLAATL